MAGDNREERERQQGQRRRLHGCCELALLQGLALPRQAAHKRCGVQLSIPADGRLMDPRKVATAKMKVGTGTFKTRISCSFIRGSQRNIPDRTACGALTRSERRSRWT